MGLVSINFSGMLELAVLLWIVVISIGVAVLGWDIKRRDVRSPPPMPRKYLLAAMIGNLVFAMVPASMGGPAAFPVVGAIGAALGLASGGVLSSLSRRKHYELEEMLRAQRA